eukprot:scaffold16757_cov49-Prasinocladus_malaysianus.AAC.2
MPSGWSSHEWYRKLRPSPAVRTMLSGLKSQLDWGKYLWVAIHVMDPNLTFHIPNPEPGKPPLRQKVKTVAPASSLMYEMMLARELLANSTKQLRFLLVSDHPKAVQKFQDEIAPAFEDAQLVSLTDDAVKLTFGANTKEGFKAAAARAFLLAEAERLIYVKQSAFGTIAALLGGKASVAIDDGPEGFITSMASILS